MSKLGKSSNANLARTQIEWCELQIQDIWIRPESNCDESWENYCSKIGEQFVDLAAVANVTVGSRGIEGHSILGIGERYHQPLRQTIWKIKLELDRKLILNLSVKATNDTLGPGGVLPSALVSGEFLKAGHQRLSLI